MIKAAIFDLDGTLLKTTESLMHCANMAMEELGYPPATQEDIEKFIGNGVRNLLKRILCSHGIDDEEAVEKALKIFKGHFPQECTYNVVPFEGIPRVLEEYRKKGRKLAVLSNKLQKGAEACIEKNFGTELFDRIYGERPGVPMKPDPRAVLDLLDELGVRPEETIYIGDGDTDVQVGKASGCFTVAVAWGYRSVDILKTFGPDAIVYRTEELLDY